MFEFNMHDADESDDDSDEAILKSTKKYKTLFIDVNSHWHIHERVISKRCFNLIILR